MSLIFHLKNHTHIFFDGDAVWYEKGNVVLHQSEGDFTRRFPFHVLVDITGTQRGYTDYIESEEWA